METLFILQAEAPGFDMINILLLVGTMFAAMYFFSIRPQQKKMKEQANFVDNLSKGDKVITNGGIHGRVVKMEETSILMEIDTNAKMRIDRSGISAELSQAANEGKKEA